VEITHEEINEVKGARKNILIYKYEMFRMTLDESIYDVKK